MYYFFENEKDAQEFYNFCPDKQGTQMDSKTVVKTSTGLWWFKRNGLTSFLGYCPNQTDWVDRGIFNLRTFIPKYNSAISQAGWKVESCQKKPLGEGTSYVISRGQAQLTIKDLSSYLTMVEDTIIEDEQHLLALLQ